MGTLVASKVTMMGSLAADVVAFPLVDALGLGRYSN